MTDAEKYLFDLHGYLVVEDALSPEQVAALNATVDAKMAELPEPDSTTHRFGKLLEWGPEYRRLIANPRVAGHLATLLGEPYRLDHDYLDVIRKGLGPIGATLHGGGAGDDRTAWYRYHDGRMRCGLTVVAYALKDVNPGDGGFACVPGSHKANFPLPKGWADMSERLAPGVTPVPAPAGAAIIFTEALTHGTLPWRGDHERRTIFLKYSPHPLAWAVPRYDPDAYDDLSPEERRLLEGANARYKGRAGAVE
ncbi:MAG TPA: phytanoyl-CoA dioxygenase family protein [Armatimonadaceae bacterium]|jgi:ectoine hydroxylase-related dioxygenase (phytanoyl-CoA dioxygenase family)|nr:phytanoyl-CoA dioxygenase family protein [Armatimonadaceae bacterium]